jgi:hypothetical protein
MITKPDKYEPKECMYPVRTMHTYRCQNSHVNLIKDIKWTTEFD